MDVEKATVLYFSGTGTTEAYARAFAEALHCDADVVEIRHDSPTPEAMGPHELLALVVPVYAGWAPPFVWERLEGFRGQGTPAVIMAVYGARDYDNALFEMDEKLRRKGCHTVGAAALVARHSIAQTMATDRPDVGDLGEVRAFADEVAQRLRGLERADQWLPTVSSTTGWTSTRTSIPSRTATVRFAERAPRNARWAPFPSMRPTRSIGAFARHA